eukprot:683243-Pyramimonas_sp.AAC.1
MGLAEKSAHVRAMPEKARRQILANARPRGGGHPGPRARQSRRLVMRRQSWVGQELWEGDTWGGGEE